MHILTDDTVLLSVCAGTHVQVRTQVQRDRAREGGEGVFTVRGGERPHDQRLCRPYDAQLVKRSVFTYTHTHTHTHTYVCACVFLYGGADQKSRDCPRSQ
jgi:hypothetical protein